MKASRRSIKGRRLTPIMVGASIILITAFFAYWSGFAINRLPDSAGTAIIAGCGTIIASVVTVTLTRLHERRLALEHEQQERRLPVYGEFLDCFQEFMASPGEYRKRKQMFGPFPPSLLVWGSDDVVRCWSDMRKLLTAESFDPGSTKQVMLALGDILLAMRRDLGYSNEGMSNEDIVGIFSSERGGQERARLQASEIADLIKTVTEMSGRPSDAPPKSV
jgi:hypothetical protein